MMRMQKQVQRSFDFNLPGIVIVDEIDAHLHLELKKENLSDDEISEIAELELYLDEIPDYLAIDITGEYQRLKLESSVKNTGMRTYTSDKQLKSLQREMNVFYKQLEKYVRIQIQK